MQLSRVRFPIMAAAILAFFAALWAGLLRIGLSLPSLPVALPMTHGPLMVCGFLGTLIGLERSVAFSLIWNRRWLYLGPALSAAGALLLTTEIGGGSGPFLLTLGSASLAILFAAAARRHPAPFTFVMLLGAVCWVVGNVLWLGGTPVAKVVWWWSAFLVITIAGERLELSRLRHVSQRWRRLFAIVMAFYLSGLLIASFISASAGVRISGGAGLLLALWLIQHDIARSTIRRKGLPRFAAICLLSGYAWLALSGLLAIRFGHLTAGPAYDATLHSLFLGFVMVMIFAHAPIIFPSVLGLPVTFQPTFYAHLVLLHLSLLLRLVGDLGTITELRRWGGLLNMFALLLFLGTTIWSTRRRSKT